MDKARFEEEIKKKWNNYQEEHRDEFYPNIMLLGASGAGKSSLINKVYGANIAGTSNTRPETRGHFTIYYGKDCGRSVNLIDTAGYELGQGDTYYEDIHKELTERKDLNFVHVAWYCISVANERVQDMDIEILKKLMREESIRKRLCVVFTKCDLDSDDDEKVNELNAAAEKKLGFPFKYFRTSSSSDTMDELDLNLLIKWSADRIDDKDLHRAFIAAQITDLDAKKKEAQMVIAECTAAASAVGAIPLPFADAPLLVADQLIMTKKIFDAYGISNFANIPKSLISSTILSQLGKSLVANIAKLIPGVGSLVNATVAASITGALGATVSGVCYSNVKKALNGEEVAWDNMFDESFVDALVNNCKQSKQ